MQATRFDSEIQRVVGLLLALPRIGTPGCRGTRSYPLRRHPYSLHYRIEAEIIRIFAVSHHSRKPGYWRHRL
ncbi:MAG: type II toxin-antitoxin system RelE/ParE family toxin [Burkholderiales bacterium]|nr:type II toxin-antitoxin system RelE/ParE family toxin [Burkholderiales bacterium]